LVGEEAGKPQAVSRWSGLCACLGIVLAALVVYHGTLAAPFVFDDSESIAKNATIRHLWPLGAVLSPPYDQGQTVGGRPILNLTLALNYAISGTQVGSYHALNLLIHILAGLALFGVVRRTLERVGTGGPPVRGMRATAARADGRAARPYLLAFAAALLWTVHPLQTEAVTYVVQRAESLMGLFYLLTLYCFIRGMEGQDGEVGQPSYAKASEGEEAGGKAWFLLSVGCCLLGMGTKEVMVSAPVMVFLYDRTFVSGTFREAWRRHGRWHLALAATWVLLGYLVLSAGRRGGSAGFGLGVSWWSYALTQFPAILHYLRLSFWPRPLIFDYGAQWVTDPWSIVPAFAIVAALIAGTAVALWRRPALGFLGAWFFAILAPTSLVPGNRQLLAEHRMYLALAAVIVLAVVLLGTWLGRRSLLLFLLLAGVFGALTLRRNGDYRTDLALWADTAAKRPENPYAQTNLGVDLGKEGDAAGAMARYELAVRLKPDLPEANNNLGNSLRDQGRIPEAIAHYDAALRARPDYADVYNNRGVALVKDGRMADALADFEQSLRLNPDFAEAHNNFGNALRLAGRPPEAEIQLREATRLQPDSPNYALNFGLDLVALGRLPEAAEVYRQVLQRHPEMADAHYHLGNALGQMGRLPEALAEFEEAVRLKPDYAEAQSRADQARRDLGLGGLPPR
jgi:tetratricopeptide (TPR) repeat protein